jgi:hypothetical protein
VSKSKVSGKLPERYPYASHSCSDLNRSELSVSRHITNFSPRFRTVIR